MCDQFVDRTSGRIDTFYDGPIVTHLSSADVYDPVLRGLAVATIRDHGIEVHDGGTVVVIQGPRFSSKAESKWFSDAGWEVINMTQYPEAWLCRELGMAVVNIALITDYDAGVIEGTEAVDAMSVLEVFQQNAERIQAVVLDLIGRFPADLDALGARAALDPTRGDGHAMAPRGHPAVRDRPVTDSVLDPAEEHIPGSRLPIGVSIRTIRAEPGWWLESARRLDAAGYAGVWAWDHFMGKGDPTVPVVECWTALSMAAAQTERITVGLVRAQRHEPPPGRSWRGWPRPSRSLSGGRLVLGIGIGGAPKEHEAYGIDFPAAPERVARLEEAVAVIRAMWTGGPVTRDSPYYPLHEASAHPVPNPPPPIIVGGETPAGARLAGRIGDGWSAFDDNFEQNLPLYLESLEAAGSPARGPARARRLPGRLAGRRVDRGVAVGPGAARDLGALAGGRRRRRDRPGPHDLRHRRPGRGGRALVAPVRGTITA